MAKGKHQRRQQIFLSFLAVLLLAISFLSTGITIGRQLTKQPQPQIYKTRPVQLASNLTSNEQMLASEVDQLLQKPDYIGSIRVRRNNQVILEKGYGYINLRIKESNPPSLYYQVGPIQETMTTLPILKQI